jgi:hypothetical protein
LWWLFYRARLLVLPSSRYGLYNYGLLGLAGVVGGEFIGS